MSALGHKQTYAVQKAMSELPPIATAKAIPTKGAVCFAPESGHVRCGGSCLLWAMCGLSAAQPVMSALLLKADVCGANRHVCFGPIADIETMLITRGYDFAYVFLARFCAQYICADARPNWNPGAPPTLCSRVRPFDSSIRKTDDEIAHRKCLECCRSPHAQRCEIAP